MKKNNSILFLVVLLIYPMSIVFSQNEYESIKKDIYVLAADSLMGRKAGTKYADKAANYIFSRFKEIGLEPQFQYFKHDTNFKNIVCIIEGSDPKLKNEYIVIGAHYDHLGYKVNKVNNWQKGSFVDTLIYNGADDNASGVAALLELASMFKENAKDFKRSIILVSFDAEESGLFGSIYSAKNGFDYKGKKIESNDIKLMYSFDMIGYLKKSKYLNVVGYGMLENHEQYFNNLELGNDYGIRLHKFDFGMMGGSDQDAFAIEKVPSLYFSTGMYSPYHHQADDAELIDFDGIKTISDYVYKLTKNFSDAKEITTSGKFSMKHKNSANYIGVQLGYGSSQHLYKDGYVNGKAMRMLSAGLFGELSFNNTLGLKTGIGYNNLKAGRMEGEISYQSATIPLLLVTKQSFLNYIETSLNLGVYYENIFKSYSNEKDNMLTKHNLGFQFEIVTRIYKYFLGYQYRIGFNDIWKNNTYGKTNQSVNAFIFGYVF